MEKLLNLLQEFYWENRKFSNDYWLLTMTNWVENLSGAHAQTYIISKQGWFIKWLVDDKIDIEKLEEKAERKPHYIFTTDDWRLWFKLFEVYESLLMLLAIQDEPIRFICEILK